MQDSWHDPTPFHPQGLEGKEISSPSGRRRKMSLTSPLIEQAIALFNPEENIFPDGRRVLSGYFAT